MPPVSAWHWNLKVFSNALEVSDVKSPSRVSGSVPHMSFWSPGTPESLTCWQEPYRFFYALKRTGEDVDSSLVSEFMS